MKKIKGGLIKIGKYEFDIPEYRFYLLYLSIEPPKNIDASSFIIEFSPYVDGGKVEIPKKDESSTIFLNLEIEKPKNDYKIGSLGYFPNYPNMNKNQRWVYLNWLQDITDNIEIGYVFTFYYGLERLLRTDKYEQAFHEINLLRKYHGNTSFQKYSLHALIQSAINKEHYELLKDINFTINPNYIEDDILFLHYITGRNIDANYLTQIIKSTPGTNKRYIKINIDLYKKVLQENLIEEYGYQEFPFSNIFDSEDIDTLQLRGSANYSLDQYRTYYYEYPYFMGHKPFLDEVRRIHLKTHEDVKSILRINRNQK